MIDVSLFVRFSKKLRTTVEERLERLAAGVGVMVKDDPAATGLNYARQIGYLEGLRDAEALLDASRRELEGGDEDERKSRKRESA